jgi:hypothetical protein
VISEWWIQFYPDGASDPDAPIYFDGFPELLEHVQGFEAARVGKGILHVHLPARSTDDERRQLREAGYDQDVFPGPGVVLTSRGTIG